MWVELVGGVGGGVEITSLEISDIGVAGGRDATNTFHRRAKGKMRTRKRKKKLSPSNAPGCA